MSKKQRLEAARKQNDDYYKTLGYKGGKSLRGKYGRRIGVNALPDLRAGLSDMPPTSDVICSNGNKRESIKYTGTLVKGIAQTHKSNAVPVINQQEILDIARMRR